MNVIRLPSDRRLTNAVRDDVDPVTDQENIENECKDDGQYFTPRRHYCENLSAPIQQPHEHEPTSVCPPRAKPGVCMAQVTEVNPAISERVAQAAKKNHLEADDQIELPGFSVVLLGLWSAPPYIMICFATPGYGPSFMQSRAVADREGDRGEASCASDDSASDIQQPVSLHLVSRLPKRCDTFQGGAAEHFVLALCGHAPRLFHVSRVNRQVWATTDDSLRPGLFDRREQSGVPGTSYVIGFQGQDRATPWSIGDQTSGIERRHTQ
jgi:hypothetical protein